MASGERAATWRGIRLEHSPDYCNCYWARGRYLIVSCACVPCDPPKEDGHER